MKNFVKILSRTLCAVFLLAAVLSTVTATAYAADSDAPAAPVQVQLEDNSVSAKAISAALVVGLAAATGAIAMGMAISKSADGISRQPEAEGKIRTMLMLGLVFIETVVIYALIVAILIIFVL